MKRTLLIFVAVMASMTARAQAVMLNPNPGKVADKEVALASYPLDTTAAAVFLVNRTEVAIRVDKPEQLRLEKPILLDISTITYHRVKILKETGWEELTRYELTVPFVDRIDQIKVTTYNMVNGKVVKSKLAAKNISREKISDELVTYSFTAPEVRKGSVIEVSYQHVSNDYLKIPELRLQRAYPINFATASLDYPDYFLMNKEVRGYIEPRFTVTHPILRGLSDELPPYHIVSHRYSLADVPALHNEYSSICPEQYMVAVQYEVAQATIQNFLEKIYSTEWSDVDSGIKDGQIVKQCAVKGKFLDPFISNEKSEKAAIAQVRQNVLNAVKWDGAYTLFPGNIRDVLRDGIGSSASLNAIVASTLNSMGYKASPVLLRSRDKGAVSEEFVTTDAFTNMILKIVTPSGASYYFDAAPEEGNLDIFNPLFLVDKARVYPIGNYAEPDWVDLTTKASATSMYLVDATLRSDCSVAGTMSLRSQGEASFQMRQKRAELSSDEELIETLEEGDLFETVSFEDQTEPYGDSYGFTLSFKQEADEEDEKLFVRPIFLSLFDKDEYPAVVRTLPVDFIIKNNIIYNYTLHIPDGYVVVDLPATKSVRLAGVDAMFSCRSLVNEDGSVSISFSYKNDSMQASAKYYDNLRVFWERLCKQAEATIVIKKQ